MAPGDSRHLQHPNVGLEILARLIAKEHIRRIRLNCGREASEGELESGTAMENPSSVEGSSVHPES